MEAVLDENTNGYYSSRDNKIHIDINKSREDDKVMGYTKHMVSFFHELWHWLDKNTIKGSTIKKSLKDFRKQLVQDFLNKCNKIIGKEYNSIKDILEYSDCFLIEDELKKDGDLKNGISDIVSGITKDRLKGYYHHRDIYWKGDTLELESIANMGEVFVHGGGKEEYMKEWFPVAYSNFCELVKTRLLKEGKE